MMSRIPGVREWLVAGGLLGTLFLCGDVWVDRLVVVTDVGSASSEVRTSVTPASVGQDPSDGGPVGDSPASEASFGAGLYSPSPVVDVELDVEPTGLRPHPNMYSESYQPRGMSLEVAARQQLTNQWGSWSLASEAPHSSDFYARHPHRDAPGSAFPAHAWQTDPTYINAFVPEAQALVRRVQEAILTEYGHGLDRKPDQSFQERSAMFQIEFTTDRYDNTNVDAGGAMNARSWQGLVRRLLHAILTQDTFRLVTAGHSVAAGHLNMFKQGYTVQVQRILEPVFARLGVTMTAHAIAVGGMGTIMNSLAGSGVYGDDIDVLLLDAGYTEPEVANSDLLLRQVLLSGIKVPFLWIRQDFKRVFQSGIYDYLDRECQVDIGVFGSGMRGIPRMETFQDLQDAPTKLPWATQYVNCDADIITECRNFEFNTTCWIERHDFQPPIPQQTNTFRMGGGKHPGNRFHQLQGRVLAFVILTALDEALDLWSKNGRNDQGQLMLPDDTAWHVDGHYRAIRDRLRGLNHTTPCHTTTQFPTRVCDLPMQGKSEFTPRVRPYRSSLRSIAVGAPYLEDLVIPNEYNPPDAIVPIVDMAGEVDVMNIVENGGPFLPLLGRRRRRWERKQDQLLKQKRRRSLTWNASSINPTIRPGLGWGLATASGPDQCDGSYDSFCERSHTTCLLLGFNDVRGGLVFDSLSGWLVLRLDNVQNGLVALKVEDYHGGENDQTKGWECESNDCSKNGDGSGHGGDGGSGDAGPPHHGRQRLLGRQIPSYCENFQFDYAIDGTITTWNLTEWKSQIRTPAMFVQLVTLLDDPNYRKESKSDSEPKQRRPVELAVRMRGCGRQTGFRLTHVYWS